MPNVQFKAHDKKIPEIIQFPLHNKTIDLPNIKFYIDLEQNDRGMTGILRQKIVTALTYSGLWIGGLLLLAPALDNWKWPASATIRLDPIVSKDYNCVFIEGRLSPRFMVPWLTRNPHAQYLRIRYAPKAADQEFGILFVNTETLAYEAHDGCAAAPTNLVGHLDSQAVIKWLTSQAGAVNAESHIKDSQEIFAAIQLLAHKDVFHFSLPATFNLENFVIGFQSVYGGIRPDGFTFFVILVFWSPVFEQWFKERRQRKQALINLPAAT